MRRLIDPSRPPLRRPPRDSRDLFVAAKGGWLVAFDNLSHITDWLSDDLASLATGGGFATRELYTADDETLFDGQRPILFNGIADVMSTHHDLRDRALTVRLAQIPKGRRRSESRFWPEFREVHPRILGALLTAASMALKRLPTIELAELPRMADFVMWVVAAEPALGWPEGTFQGAYERLLATTALEALEGDVVGIAVRKFMLDQADWSGTASELADQLESCVGDQVTKKREWPTVTNVLSNRLRRVAPSLRQAGVDIQFVRGKDRKGSRLIRITKIEDPTVTGDADDRSAQSSATPSEDTARPSPSKPNVDDELLYIDPEAGLPDVAENELEEADTDDADALSAFLSELSDSDY